MSTRITKSASSSARASIPLAIEESPRGAFNEDGQLLYANQAFYNLLGIEEGEAVSSSLPEMFGWQKMDIKSLEAGEHRVALMGSPIKSTLSFDWLTTPQGRFLLASGPDIPDHNLSQDMDSLLVRIQESAARIEKNSATQPLKNDWESFADIAHDMMVMTDHKGKILNANPAFLRLFGNRTALATGQSFIELFDTQGRAALLSVLQSQGNITDFKSVLTARDGKSCWIDWRARHENSMIYFCGRDISDIKIKSDDLQRREHQLSEAEAIGRMGHWHWLIGENSISWSEEIFRIFGVDQNRFEPSINALMDLVHKRDLGRVVQIFQRAIIEEKNYDMEFRIQRPDGQIRFILCEGRCEKDQDGEVVALYGIVQDMTERVLYEHELREAKTASEQAYAAKSQFLANMSHELRTPLNAIIGFSEMIEKQMLGPIFNEKYLDYAQSIRESGEHLLDLIGDILDMSKIEAGKHTLDLERVNVNDVLRRAINMVEGRAKEKNLSLRSPDFGDDILEIIGDRRALMQIFLNLLANAVKFTPDGGSVWVECQSRADSILFKVCDTGIGIPSNKLASVLRPFEQASSSYTREYEGTGLGLSITKELVELHHGTLTLDSIIGSGTTVSFVLPRDASIHKC